MNLQVIFDPKQLKVEEHILSLKDKTVIVITHNQDEIPRKV